MTEDNNGTYSRTNASQGDKSNIIECWLWLIKPTNSTAEDAV